MKKNVFSVMLLVLMAAALLVFTAGCSSEEADPELMAQIDALKQENADLEAQVEELTAQIDRMKQKAALQDWTLDATAWADGTGATVTFTAAPVTYVEGMRAALSVRMGDLEAESCYCVWDGTNFTGSVDLSAADGYGYYCVLTGLDGSQTEVELNSPNNISNESLVYLATNLTAYANLVIEDWTAADSALTVNSGYVQAQMPTLTFNDTVSHVSKAELVMHLNGEELSRQELALAEGENAGSYEAAVNAVSFGMPAMEDDYQLDLWLEITLNNGSVVSAAGGSWYSNNGDLQMVVG